MFSLTLLFLIPKSSQLILRHFWEQILPNIFQDNILIKTYHLLSADYWMNVFSFLELISSVAWHRDDTRRGTLAMNELKSSLVPPFVSQ